MNGTSEINETVYPTQKCTDERWTAFGNNYYYGNLDMLCLKDGEEIELTNDPSTGIYDILLIDIEFCYLHNTDCYDSDII